MATRKQPRKRDAAYWRDVRIDAIKLLEHMGVPVSDDVRHKLETMITTSDQVEAEAAKVRDMQAEIERKRKAAGINTKG